MKKVAVRISYLSFFHTSLQLKNSIGETHAAAEPEIRLTYKCSRCRKRDVPFFRAVLFLWRRRCFLCIIKRYYNQVGERFAVETIGSVRLQIICG